MKSSSTPTPDATLVQTLNLVLADSYALMALTHQAHWNIEGPGFFSLHAAFQTQYEELFAAVDEIAERIRALDAYAVGGLFTLANLAKINESQAPLDQEAWVGLLHEANAKLLADLAMARDLAGRVNDSETQDLMIGRIAVHQKTAWMLRSFLKS